MQIEAQRSPMLLKLLPSFTDFAFLIPIVMLFGRMGGFKTLLGDCDTGWHIRTGQWILANHQIPTHDIFSFSKPGQPWLAWQWLSEVLFGWLFGLGGLRAVVLFALVLLSLTFAIVFRMARARSNAIVAIVLTVFAAASSSVHWLARPLLFTLFFTVIFFWVLQRYSEGRTRLQGLPVLAILPAIMVLWANLHPGFFVGIVMLAVYGAGQVLRMLLPGEGGVDADGWRKAGRYFLTAAACALASLLNPYTYRLHQHIAWYLGDPSLSSHVMEYLSPNFHHPIAIFFESLLALAAASACWNVFKGRYTEPLMMLLWAHGSLQAERNIPLFAVSTAVLSAQSIREWLELMPEWEIAGWLRRAAVEFRRVAAGIDETDAEGRWHLVSVLGVLLVAAVVWAPNPPMKFRAEFDPDRYPAGALATLRSDPAARIFTDDEWGDYLIWSLYPTHKVFVDGRDDFYGEAFLERFNDVMTVKPDWEKILGGFDVNTILLPTDAPLVSALKESSRWRLVRDDGISVVFRPASALAVGQPVSVAESGRGRSRDREVTKTEVDRAITTKRTKT